MEEKLNDLKIVFMGTPDFAVPSLIALQDAGAKILAVITAPDKPADRGLRLRESAVKQTASRLSLPILQPPRLKDPGFLNQLRILGADLQVVVAFRMLPESVWSMPPLGTINLHASLLPRYRGAAPIPWAIIRGEEKTGLTTFKLQQAIDTGHILLQEEISIGPEQTGGELREVMKNAGAALLVRTLDALRKGQLDEIPQPESTEALPLAPKITAETCIIHWDRTVASIHNLIRGLSPNPAASGTLEGKKIKIFRSVAEPGLVHAAAGQFETDRKSFLRFVALDGYIRVLEIQLEGKRRLPIEEFLRGYRFAPVQS
jgi:methionyl-tRNA formyltransferase